MKTLPATVLAFAGFLLFSACSDPALDTPDDAAPSEALLVGEATLTVTGLPKGASVITLTWFPGQKDDDPQGIIYPYSDGMTIPAGKLMFLIEAKDYEPLMARRIPAYGNTVLEAKMCKLDQGCYGSLTDISRRD